MKQSAADVYKSVQKARVQRVKESALAFDEKCWEAIEEMAVNGEVYTEIPMEEEDFFGLDAVLRDLRKYNFKHCLIETENEEGEILSHRLRISVECLNTWV